MVERYSLDLVLPMGSPPEWEDSSSTPEENDQWQLENHLMRIARGDLSRSDTPVDVPFVWKD